jgi:hypothetical protein
MQALKGLWLAHCGGVTDADIALLATMKLASLSVDIDQGNDWMYESLQSFVGSSISRTLEMFCLSVHDDTILIDDVNLATALASCHSLKKLSVYCHRDICLFGRDGLDGLQAVAASCPLLEEINSPVTAPGLHYLGTHFTHLKKCTMPNSSVAGIDCLLLPSVTGGGCVGIVHGGVGRWVCVRRVG